MADDKTQSGPPPAGTSGAWPPAAPQPGWGQPVQPQPGWGQPVQPRPGWGLPMAGAQSGGSWQPQPGFPSPYAPPLQGGYPPPYGQPPYGPMYGYPPFGSGAPPRYAGFWIRLVAYLIDSVVFSVALVFCFFAMFLLVGFILFPLVAIGYFPYFWSKSGATPGMQAMGLRVVRATDGGPLDMGTAFVRLIGFWTAEAIRVDAIRAMDRGCVGARSGRFGALPADRIGRVEQAVSERPFCGELGGRLGGETPFPGRRHPPSMHPTCRGGETRGGPKSHPGPSLRSATRSWDSGWHGQGSE
jgi:uncharacterized RDD family membrane protein YckC